MRSLPTSPIEPQQLVHRLRERGFLRSDALAEALDSVPRAALLPEVCKPLGAADAPAPLVDPLREAPPCPSPRVVVTLLEALDVEPGHRVRIEGAGIGWIAALAGSIVNADDGGTGEVVALERDEGVREAARARIHDELGLNAVHVVSYGASPDGAFDRILVTEPRQRSTLPRSDLAEDGQLVSLVPDPEEGIELVRLVETAGDVAEMGLGQVHVGEQPEGLKRAGEDEPMSAAQLLTTESLLMDAWTRSNGGPTAQEIRGSVAEMMEPALEVQGIDPDALSRQGTSDPQGLDPSRARAAWGAFHVGYVHQMTGDFREAVTCYAASAAILPTAEAFTFRGWAKSFRGDVEGAIADCKQAIDTDPTLGNPYNDIGAYLLELDRPEEAVEWLKQATEAERYPSPQFPYLNLGRAYLEMGEKSQARQALEQVLEIDPDNEPARRLLRRIEDRS